jgi:hypothetical protein
MSFLTFESKDITLLPINAVATSRLSVNTSYDEISACRLFGDVKDKLRDQPVTDLTLTCAARRAVPADMRCTI